MEYPTNTSNRKKIIILAVVLAVIVLTGLFIWLLMDNKEEGPGEQNEYNVGSEEYLTEVPGLPKTEWKREIDIQKEGDAQIITNPFDGYQITIPGDWSINENVFGGLGGLSVAYGQEEEHGDEEGGVQHIDDGLVVTIIANENPNKLGLIKWLSTPEETGTFFKGSSFKQVQSEQYEIYKNETPFMQDRFENNRITEVLIEDTLSVKYAIKSPAVNTIYVVVCTIYNNVSEFAPLCESIIPSFTILN